MFNTGTHLLPRPPNEFGILYPRQPTNRGSDNGAGDIDRNNENGTGGSDVSTGGPGAGGPGASGPGTGLGGMGGSGAGESGGDGFDIFGNVDNNSIDSDIPFPSFDDNGKKDNQPGNGKNDLDFPKRDRGETIIFNSGDGFFAIPPGASARAHVQNIDLRLSDTAISPSEALRRDERRFLRLRFRG